MCADQQVLSVRNEVNKAVTVLQPELLTNKHWGKIYYTTVHVGTTESEKHNIYYAVAGTLVHCSLKSIDIIIIRI